jgi:hypothetical protein
MAFSSTTFTVVPQRAGQIKHEVEIHLPFRVLTAAFWREGAEADCLWIPLAPIENPAIAASFKNFLRLRRE